MSISHLVLQASFPAQFILLLLLCASIFSWTLIHAKRKILAKTKAEYTAFEARFWSGGSLTELYSSLGKPGGANTGVAAIFKSGFEEYSRQQSGSPRSIEDALAAVQRQMRVATMREIERLESGLSWLATIASASPYIGLFGTVWGIMSAFIAIGNVKQASLAMVAPGIAEALIATAMGLFAAIPAMIAYNFLTRNLEQIENNFSTFSEELIGIIDRGLRVAKK